MKQYNRTKAKYIQISRSYEEHINSVLFYSHVNILHGVCLPTHLSCVPGRVAQSVGHPTHMSGVLGSIPGLATYFRFSFRFFKKGSCQLLAKVCA